MAILTAGTSRFKRNMGGVQYAKFLMTASTTIFEGALVCVTSSNVAVNAADTAGQVFVGICTNTITSAATGSFYVEVEYGHEELLSASSTLAAVIGAAAVVTDNDSVTTAALGTNDIKVGVVTEALLSPNRGWVGIRVAQTV